jgi:hypothetical protein
MGSPYKPGSTEPNKPDNAIRDILSNEMGIRRFGDYLTVMHFKFSSSFLFTCILALLSTVNADMTVTQVLEEMNQNQPLMKEQITLQVSGKRVRVDKGQAFTSIILADKKQTFSIMHEARQYVTLPHDSVSAEPKIDSNQADGIESVRSTGKTNEISGFACREVEIKEKGGLTTHLWISDTALNQKNFVDEFKSFMEFGFGQTNSLLDKYPVLRGMPIRITESIGDKILRQSTVTKLDTSPIPPQAFEVPAGYQELKIEKSETVIPPRP